MHTTEKTRRTWQHSFLHMRMLTVTVRATASVALVVLVQVFWT